jgi:hypothetical protein
VPSGSTIVAVVPAANGPSRSIGNDLWNAQTQQWEGVGFQPPYSETHAEAMEYATGLVQLVRVAQQYAQQNGMP